MEEEAQVHRIRITLTSKNVAPLEKVGFPFGLITKFKHYDKITNLNTTIKCF